MALNDDFTAENSALHPFMPEWALVYGVSISLKHKYIYVETPKCACSTIKSTLQRLELEDPTFTRAEFEDLHLREFSPLLNPKQVGSFPALLARPDFFKFCFVRHPFTRLVSCYLDKIAGNRVQKREILAHMGLPPADLTVEVSFRDFVRAVVEQPFANMDPHWRPQYYQTMQAAIGYDFVGRFENLDADLRTVGARISPEFGRYMVDERRHATRTAERREVLLTAGIKAQLRKKYRVDLEHFGYAPD